MFQNNIFKKKKKIPAGKGYPSTDKVYSPFTFFINGGLAMDEIKGEFLYEEVIVKLVDNIDFSWSGSCYWNCSDWIS